MRKFKAKEMTLEYGKTKIPVKKSLIGFEATSYLRKPPKTNIEFTMTGVMNLRNRKDLFREGSLFDRLRLAYRVIFKKTGIMNLTVSGKFG